MTGEQVGAPRTWAEWLARAERALAAAGTPAPEEEAGELLRALLGEPAALAGGLNPPRPQDVAVYEAWVARRAAGEALPYITGKLEFMGLELSSGRGDPLPGPGAPWLVDVALRVARSLAPGELSGATLAAGCGAVPLALAAFEPRFTRIYALEAPATSRATAEANGARYLLNLVVTWLDGDSLVALPAPVDILALTADMAEAGAAGWLARALGQARPKLRPGGAIVVAADEQSRMAITAALATAAPRSRIWEDAPPSGTPGALSGARGITLVAQLPRAEDGWPGA